MDELNQILFQRFLDNDLSAAEKQAFEERLLNDQSFQSEFELFQAMDVFLHKKVRQGDSILKTHKNHDPQLDYKDALVESNKHSLTPLFKLGAIAVLIGLAILVIWLAIKFLIIGMK